GRPPERGDDEVGDRAAVDHLEHAEPEEDEPKRDAQDGGRVPGGEARERLVDVSDHPADYTSTAARSARACSARMMSSTESTVASRSSSTLTTGRQKARARRISSRAT